MLMKRDAALDGWLLRCISHLLALKVIRIQCYNICEFMGWCTPESQLPHE